METITSHFITCYTFFLATTMIRNFWKYWSSSWSI